MFVGLCLASKKPSAREFFVPAGTDIAVKLLRWSHICNHRCIPVKRNYTCYAWAGGSYAKNN